MRRDDAVTCLKEINANFKDLFANAIALIESKQDDQLSRGYRLHIKMVIDDDCKKQIKAIAAKHGLSVREAVAELIIYRPKEVTGELSRVP